MPLIHVKLSSPQVPNTDLLMKALSSEIADLTGKPEKYVMCLLQTHVPMLFGGNNEPSCYVQIKSIGALKPPEMTKAICELISTKADIPIERIYVNFEDIEASNWGFNSRTFG